MTNKADLELQLRNVRQMRAVTAVSAQTWLVALVFGTHPLEAVAAAGMILATVLYTLRMQDLEDKLEIVNRLQEKHHG
jgi:hypothetical protein